MFKKIGLLITAILFVMSAAQAQNDTSRLRITLLTCGTGDETWETFGHTAIRVTDSVAGTDVVFNYGTFYFTDDFAWQFMKGKLLYHLSYYAYELFVKEYESIGRSVREQELLLSPEKKAEFYDFLKWNSEEENKYYKYDFFFDNCATRIRDVFPKSLGKGFKFGKTIAAEKRLTFRNIINQYYYYKHWERFGVNILLGSRIDKVMTNEDIMFLPDYLQEGITEATLNGKPISTEPVVVVPGSPARPTGVNWPLVLMSIVGLLTILGLTVRSLKPLGKIMSFLVLFVTGLLGCLIVVMWLGTDHQGCQNNFNILWTLPANLFLAFAPKRNKDKYAVVAIICILLALILHLLHVQELPLLELFPLLLAQLFIFGAIYRKGKHTKA